MNARFNIMRSYYFICGHRDLTSVGMGIHLTNKSEYLNSFCKHRNGISSIKISGIFDLSLWTIISPINLSKSLAFFRYNYLKSNSVLKTYFEIFIGIKN